MNAEMKEKWCRNLESGKFKKGKGQFKKNGKYCCLGVLNEQEELGYSDTADYFAPSTLSRIGLSYDIQDKLVGINDSDSHRKGFKYIAKWIRRNVPVT